MTKWTSIQLLRNLSRECTCFDCMRARGRTIPGQRDCLGHFRDAADGRFTAHNQINKEGEEITSERRQYIGT